MDEVRKEITERDVILISAFLHDIGKFYQRSFPKRRENHEKLGAECFDEYFREPLKQVGFNDEQLEEIRKNINNHHTSPRDYITSADRFAAGMERIERDKEERGDPKGERLIALPCRLYNWKKNDYVYYPLKPLSLEKKVIFPGENQKGSYEDLWKGFCRELKLLPISSFDAYFVSLYYLMLKYTWCVPSAVYKDEPDISLFDHLKATAAIALCLYEKDRAGVDGENMALLVGGDISGIQRFIYAISSSGVAKGLKGRSLFLELFNNAAACFLLRELGNLPLTNLVSASGGHFTILAPVTVREKIGDINQRIEEKLIHLVRGELGFVLASVPLSEDDFRNKKFGEKLGELSGRLGKRKRTKYSTLLPSAYDEVFGPFGQGGFSDRCDICHHEGYSGNGFERKITRKDREKRENVPICSLCSSFEKLGEKARNASFLFEEEVGEPESSELTWSYILESTFGVRYQLIPEEKKEDHLGKKGILYRLNDTRFLSEDEGEWRSLGVGFKFMGNHTPIIRGGGIADFGKLAERSEGASYWGIVRMDVDSLGDLFIKGFSDEENGGENYASFSRLSSFSRILSLFFEGYLNNICKETGEDKLYIIYSGGDDLFVVGSWDEVLSLALRVREEFKEYVRNERITISGGFDLEKTKYPLYKAAEKAGNNLEQAKQYEEGKKRKNAFSLFGQVLSWEEFEKARELKEELLDRIKEKKLSRSFLHKLALVYHWYQKEVEKERKKRITLKELDNMVIYGRWKWMLHYYLARRGGGELAGKIERCINYLNVPLRWVELLTKEKEDER